MPSALMLRIYRGDRTGAERQARTLPALDIFEAAALGALEALIERCEEDAHGISTYSDDGWTPLHFAAYYGNTACVKDLLRRGADKEARARNGTAATALLSACSGNQTDAALALIAAGADVNAVQHGGYHPLDSALQHGNTELARELRGAGARSRDDDDDDRR